MKISSISLKQFKKFTDLSITQIPATVKLVVLTGPNGSGKSSLLSPSIFGLTISVVLILVSMRFISSVALHS